MQNPLRLNKSLGEIETESGVFELFATAEATYDEQTGSVVVMLNSFLQLQRAKCLSARLFADSIVGRRTVTKEATEEKYGEAVSSIFANWVHGLQQTTVRPSVGARSAGPATAAAIAFISRPSRSSSV